jgi:hypothetical protein
VRFCLHVRLTLRLSGAANRERIASLDGRRPSFEPRS